MRSFRGSTGAVPLGILIAVEIFACSGGDNSASETNPGPEAGSPDGSIDAVAVDAPAGPKQSGTVAILGSNTGIAKATVEGASKQATANDDGAYSLLVPTGTPYDFRARAQGYFATIESEYSITTDTARGFSFLMDLNTGRAIGSALPLRDPSLGVMVVTLQNVGKCTDTTGAVLNVTCNGGQRCWTPPATDAGADANTTEDASADAAAADAGGDASAEAGQGADPSLGLGPQHPFIAYFRGGVPVPPSAATSVSGTEAVAAIIWNLPTGRIVESKVAKPDGSCKMKPFPVTVPGEGGVGAFTYTGKVLLEPVSGDVTSISRLFVE